MKEIIKIKIPKAIAGVKIPYDLIYLITRDQRELVHKLWDYALVMPFEESFQRVIFDLYPKFYSKLSYNRNDALLRLPITDKEIHTPSYRLKRSERNRIASAWWSSISQEYALTERLVVIPLLLRREHEKLLPRYLGAKRWIDRQLPAAAYRGKKRSKGGISTTDVKFSAPVVATLSQPISDLAYLSTPYEMPNDKLRPLCSICPRSFQHLQGQCIPGMPVCYSTLDISNILSNKKLPVINNQTFAQSGYNTPTELAPVAPAYVEDEEITF